MLLKDMVAHIQKCGKDTPEAWTPVVAHLISLVEDIKLGWGTHDELVTFWIDGEFHMFGEFPSDAIKQRYQVMLLQAEEIIDRLKPFDYIRTNYGN